MVERTGNRTIRITYLNFQFINTSVNQVHKSIDLRKCSRKSFSREKNCHKIISNKRFADHRTKVKTSNEIRKLL